MSHTYRGEYVKALQTVREHWLMSMKLVGAVPVYRACVDFDLELVSIVPTSLSSRKCASCSRGSPDRKAPPCRTRPAALTRRSMCARQFLIAVFILTLIVAAAGFAIYQWGGNVLLKEATPKGHFQAAQANEVPDYTEASSWVARPGLPEDPALWLPEGRARRCRQGGDILRPSDDLPRDRPLECAAGCRRRRRSFGPTVRPEPGERVQRRRGDLGAALSPGRVRRVPAQKRGCQRGARPRLSRRRCRFDSS